MASGAKPVIAVNVRVVVVLETIVISLSAAASENPAPPVIRTLLPASWLVAQSLAESTKVVVEPAPEQTP